MKTIKLLEPIKIIFNDWNNETQINTEYEKSFDKGDTLKIVNSRKENGGMMYWMLAPNNHWFYIHKNSFTYTLSAESLVKLAENAQIREISLLTGYNTQVEIVNVYFDGENLRLYSKHSEYKRISVKEAEITANGNVIKIKHNNCLDFISLVKRIEADLLIW